MPGGTCRRCQAENDSGARFCEECGAQLPLVCPTCGQPITPGKSFCRSCGRALPSAPGIAASPERFASPESYTPRHLAEKILTSKSALEGERKLVTVLFCDLANSTALAERIGAEAMHGLLNRFFDLALAEVHRYEGTINQFLGDGFMALFGAPIAHEDHARRAALAALGIQRALREREESAEEEIEARIGLNTGPVVVGTIGDNLRMDYTAVGDTTNLAARLQQHAAPGAILLSEATGRLVRGYVRLEPLPPLQVKGKTEAVGAFRILGLGTRRSPLDGREDRPLSPFVGRGREMATLRDVLADVEAGRGQVIGLVGEAGVGKSRVVYEFRRGLAERRITALEGRCLSYGRAIPYLPLQEIIRDNCGITDPDTPGEIGEKVRAALDQVGMDAEAGAPYLLQMLGVKEGTEGLAQIGPETIKVRIFATLRQLTLAGSRRRPLVLAVEDLHWIDKTSEEYFAAVVEHLAGAPVLLLTTSRPGYQPPWLGKSYATQIALRPLSAEHSRTLVQSTVERADLAGPMTDLILGKGEGNPFFLEELTRAVLEQADAALAAGVPDTIQGVLMARIDRLGEPAKRVLQTASVLGREFSSRLLEAVREDGGDLAAHLAELTRVEFLYERSGGAEPVYVFKHALTQEVAYESLLTPRREALHEAAGRALEALFPERLEEQYEGLAYHYSHSGNAEKALEYLELANQKAAKANAMEEAKASFEEAMRILDRLPDSEANRERRIRLLVNQMLVFLLLYRMPEYHERLTRYEPAAAALREPGLRGSFYARLGHCEWVFGQFDRSIETLLRAAELCEAAGLPEDTGFAYVFLQWSYLYKGDWDLVLRWETPALEKMEERFHPRWYAWALAASAQAHGWSGRWAAAEDTAMRELRAAQEVSDDSLISFAAWILALVYTSKGDPQGSVRYGELAVEKAPTPADKVWAQTFLAYAWCRAGEPAKAAAVLSELLPLYQATGFLGGVAGTRIFLGEAHWRCGDYGKARETLQGGLQLAEQLGMKFLTGYAHRLLGEVFASEQVDAEAATHFEKSIEILERIRSENELALAYAGYGRLHVRQGDRGRAQEYLTRALEIFERLGTLIEPDRVRQELAG